MSNAFGSTIKKARQDAGLTQNDLAVALDVTQQTLSRWESGHVLPRFRQLPGIARALNVPLADLEHAATEDDLVGRNGSSRIQQVEQELASTKILLADLQAKLEEFVTPQGKRVKGKGAKPAPGRQVRKRA